MLKRYAYALAASLFVVFPLAALAGEAVIQGIDPTGHVKYIAVDASGQLLTSGSGAGGSTSSANFNTTTSTTALTANATACSTPGGASCTVVFSSTDVLVWPRLAITITNSNAMSAALSNCIVEWSADGVNWEAWDTSTFTGLAANTTKSMNIDGNARKYLRIEAQSTVNTSLTVTLTTSQG